MAIKLLGTAMADLFADKIRSLKTCPISDSSARFWLGLFGLWVVGFGAF